MHQPQENDPNNVTLLRRLQWITFINYWVGFPFFLTHGILSHCAFPALGLLPMSVSFLTACYRLIKLHKKDGQYQILLGGESDSPKKDAEPLILAIVDLGIVGGDILAFVFTCLFTYARSYGGRWQALAAYATVTIFVDIAIHAYFFSKAAHKLFKRQEYDCAVHCPNCRAAREGVESSEERYTDIVEVTTAPKERGENTRA